MARLSKATAKLHQQACALLEKDRLTEDDKWFVYENWQESAKHINSLAGAFFTPTGLARDFALEIAGGPIIDLCAGIGVLSFMAYHYAHHEKKPRMVCVEKNPDYVAVGKKLLPEAEWICGDVFDLPDLGRFGTAISNPPFGAVSKSGKGPRYTGSEFEYAVIDIASDLADYGAFIIPQNSAPFEYSGKQNHSIVETEKTKKFFDQTNIYLRAGCGIDCEYHRDGWHFTAPAVEVAVCDFEEVRAARKDAIAQPSLFESEAA